MVVRAELRVLLETLKHELELDSLQSPLKESGQPIDAIWSGFAVEESLFVKDSGGGGMNPPEFDRSQKRKVLAALVDARLANDGQGDPAAELAALNQIPPGFSLSQTAWDAIT